MLKDLFVLLLIFVITFGLCFYIYNRKDYGIGINYVDAFRLINSSIGDFYSVEKFQNGVKVVSGKNVIVMYYYGYFELNGNRYWIKDDYISYRVMINLY